MLNYEAQTLRRRTDIKTKSDRTSNLTLASKLADQTISELQVQESQISESKHSAQRGQELIDEINETPSLYQFYQTK